MTHLVELNSLLEGFPPTPGLSYIRAMLFVHSFTSKRNKKLTFSVLGNAETLWNFLKQSIVVFTILQQKGYVFGFVVPFESCDLFFPESEPCKQSLQLKQFH